MIAHIKNPRRAEIYISGGRHTAEQVRKLTGADLVINGGLFDLRTLQPCCHLRAKGIDYASDQWEYIYGYGWNSGNARLQPVNSKNKVTVDNYICDSWMITEGRAVDMIYDSAQGGKRGNTAIGRLFDGTIVVDVHTDHSTERISPEGIQAEMLAAGCRDALRLDGGQSSALSADGVEHFYADAGGNIRRCHNYLCFWGDVSYLDTKKNVEEEMSVTEIQLRQTVIDTALAWEGKNEADGSYKEIIDLYNAYKPLPVGYKVKYTDDWCATFVSAVFIKLGLTDIAPPECGCERMVKLYQSLGCWQEKDDYVPTAGDLIFYDWADSGKGDNVGWADHVGIVLSAEGGTITAIEGNKSNMVKRVSLPINGKTIRGFALPDYASKATTAVIVPESPAAYAAAACGKAVAKGVIQGDGQGNYGWPEPVTRQDLCVVLDRLGLL